MARVARLGGGEKSREAGKIWYLYSHFGFYTMLHYRRLVESIFGVGDGIYRVVLLLYTNLSILMVRL